MFHLHGHKTIMCGSHMVFDCMYGWLQATVSKLASAISYAVTAKTAEATFPSGWWAPQPTKSTHTDAQGGSATDANPPVSFASNAVSHANTPVSKPLDTVEKQAGYVATLAASARLGDLAQQLAGMARQAHASEPEQAQTHSLAPSPTVHPFTSSPVPPPLRTVAEALAEMCTNVPSAIMPPAAEMPEDTDAALHPPTPCSINLLVQNLADLVVSAAAQASAGNALAVTSAQTTPASVCQPSPGRRTPTKRTIGTPTRSTAKMAASGTALTAATPTSVSTAPGVLLTPGSGTVGPMPAYLAAILSQALQQAKTMMAESTEANRQSTLACADSSVREPSLSPVPLDVSPQAAAEDAEGVSAAANSHISAGHQQLLATNEAEVLACAAGNGTQATSASPARCAEPSGVVAAVHMSVPKSPARTPRSSRKQTAAAAPTAAAPVPEADAGTAAATIARSPTVTSGTPLSACASGHNAPAVGMSSTEVPSALPSFVATSEVATGGTDDAGDVAAPGAGMTQPAEAAADTSVTGTVQQLESVLSPGPFMSDAAAMDPSFVTENQPVKPAVAETMVTTVDQSPPANLATEEVDCNRDTAVAAATYDEPPCDAAMEDQEGIGLPEAPAAQVPAENEDVDMSACQGNDSKTIEATDVTQATQQLLSSNGVHDADEVAAVKEPVAKRGKRSAKAKPAPAKQQSKLVNAVANTTVQTNSCEVVEAGADAAAVGDTCSQDTAKHTGRKRKGTRQAVVPDTELQSAETAIANSTVKSGSDGPAVPDDNKPEQPAAQPSEVAPAPSRSLRTRSGKSAAEHADTGAVTSKPTNRLSRRVQFADDCGSQLEHVKTLTAKPEKRTRRKTAQSKQEVQPDINKADNQEAVVTLSKSRRKTCGAAQEPVADAADGSLLGAGKDAPVRVSRRRGVAAAKDAEMDLEQDTVDEAQQAACPVPVQGGKKQAAAPELEEQPGPAAGTKRRSRQADIVDSADDVSVDKGGAPSAKRSRRGTTAVVAAAESQQVTSAHANIDHAAGKTASAKLLSGTQVALDVEQQAPAPNPAATANEQDTSLKQQPAKLQSRRGKKVLLPSSANDAQEAPTEEATIMESSRSAKALKPASDATDVSILQSDAMAQPNSKRAARNRKQISAATVAAEASEVVDSAVSEGHTTSTGRASRRKLTHDNVSDGQQQEVDEVVGRQGNTAEGRRGRAAGKTSLAAATQGGIATAEEAAVTSSKRRKKADLDGDQPSAAAGRMTRGTAPTSKGTSAAAKAVSTRSRAK